MHRSGVSDAPGRPHASSPASQGLASVRSAVEQLRTIRNEEHSDPVGHRHAQKHYKGVNTTLGGPFASSIARLQDCAATTVSHPTPPAPPCKHLRQPCGELLAVMAGQRTVSVLHAVHASAIASHSTANARAVHRVSSCSIKCGCLHLDATVTCMCGVQEQSISSRLSCLHMRKHALTKHHKPFSDDSQLQPAPDGVFFW